ncbi:enoyl-CoA hydratase-related protein [Nocardioides alcanivorans]|uniref:enoyl-CoA hydratase-related protein n=1 Tax=Nocardioides alcanivorans TaxID=2897352 RepID=UPI0024B10108|nr:enoyl-CoA hydratase-related protein [Nocardioides alcanivorans]
MNILVDHPRPHVRRITLNRPDSMNAFTLDLLAEFTDAVTEANRDRDCRALVVTGAGRGFCAGVDLKTPGFEPFLDDRDPIEGRTEWGEFVTAALMSVRNSSLPVIAAVNGIAVGGGLSLALLADIRVAGASARFADAYIRNGLSGCELGTSFLLPASSATVGRWS